MWSTDFTFQQLWLATLAVSGYNAQNKKIKNHSYVKTTDWAPFPVWKRVNNVHNAYSMDSFGLTTPAVAITIQVLLDK